MTGREVGDRSKQGGDRALLDRGFGKNRGGDDSGGDNCCEPIPTPPPVLNQLVFSFSGITLCSDCIDLSSPTYAALVNIWNSTPVSLNDTGGFNDQESFPSESPSNEWTLVDYNFQVIARVNPDCSPDGGDSIHIATVTYDVTFSGGVWTVDAITHTAGFASPGTPFFHGSIAGINPYTTGSVVVPNDYNSCSTATGLGGTATITFTNF